ncbi:MAG: DUF1947 domain-containing protein [Desulfurococcales archaeon]|nr:DUF1947 domain-containing protein [Desulfurococcales archaeon]
MKASKRYKLSKKESKRFLGEISKLYPNLQLGKASIEYALVSDVELYIVDGIPMFFRDSKGRLVPVLLYLIKKGADWLPRVVVDRGATKAVGRGADLMVPGIRSLDDFDAGSIVVVVDEDTGVAVAVGEALLSSEEIREKLSGERRGRAVKIIHRPGDRVWEAAKAV